MTRRVICLLGVAVLGSLAYAQETAERAVYPDTEYVSGRAGMSSKMKGQLVIDATQISFKDASGKSVFDVPMKQVASASGNAETDPGSFGRKMALGVFASKREEFLTVKTETDTGAEAIVFKCKKKTSDGMAAKIDFYRKKAAETKN